MITAWKLPHYHCICTLASQLTQHKQLPLAQACPTMLAFTGIILWCFTILKQLAMSIYGTIVWKFCAMYQY